MWYLGYTGIVDNLVIVKMSNICCYPLGFTIWYQVLILTGWNFISSYPLGPLSYSRLVDNYLVRPPHCFTVCVYHIIFHLIFAVSPTSYPSHLSQPSAITPNSPMTHCVYYCVTVCPLHIPLSPPLLYILRLRYPHPLFRLTVCPQLNHLVW